MLQPEDIEWDETTGLPVLPEGYFWRIHDQEWGDEDYSAVRPTLSIVSKKTVVRFRTRQKLVKTTWSGREIYESIQEEFEEEQDVVYHSHHFGKQFAFGHDAKIPDIATDVWQRSSTETSFKIPLNEEGIKWIAFKVYRSFYAEQEKERKREEARQAVKEAREKFYGDYPPKKLEG